LPLKTLPLKNLSLKSLPLQNLLPRHPPLPRNSQVFDCR
jgi:hypothetical protein